MYCIVIGVVALCVLVFLVWASADISSGVYLKTLCREKCDRPVIALTFDDGPDEVMTPLVLDVLKEYDVRAAFFLIGAKAEKHPDIVKRIVAEGHTIGNHAYSHSPLFPLSASSKVDIELERTRRILYEITDKRVMLFRPPFGVTNPIIGKSARKNGYISIGWSVRSLDTVMSRSRQCVCQKVMDKIRNGDVVLLHDGLPDADILLRMILDKVLRQGFTIEKIEDLFNIRAYGN